MSDELVFGLWSLVFGLCTWYLVLCALARNIRPQRCKHEVQSTKHKDQKPLITHHSLLLTSFCANADNPATSQPCSIFDSELAT